MKSIKKQEKLTAFFTLSREKNNSAVVTVKRAMTPVLISSLLLIFCFTPRVESDIHSILRELDNSDLEESNDDTESLNEYRKTLIKQEILNRLGLSSPPNISDSSFLPKQVIEDVLLQRKSEDDEITKDVDAYYGVTKQVVVAAEQGKSCTKLRWTMPISILNECLCMYVKCKITQNW